MSHRGFFFRLKVLLETIKISHSVFALPFALAAMVMAAGGWPGLKTFLLILVCMVSARAAAMAFNRWADREIDAQNPRTRGRASVTGLLSPSFLLGFTVVHSLIFVLGAAALNWVCFLCSFPVLAWHLAYSYTKRFTSFSHFWLGLSLGFSPLGAHLAVRGDFGALPGLGQVWGFSWEPFPFILGLAVVFWVAGFDLIYACQDWPSDWANPGLHSLPKLWGIRGALALSSALHLLAMFLLALFGGYAHFGARYFLAMFLIAGLLIYQHCIIRPGDLSRADTAFFTANGLISLVWFLAVLVEKY